MKMPSAGGSLLLLVAVVTSVGGFIADWNETHVYNPRWPPHAKFHNGQTMSTGLVLGLSSIYYICSKGYHPSIELQRLYFSIWLLSIYWVTQLSAAVYPGALPVDPEFGEGFPQAKLCGVLFVFIATGFFLENRRIASAIQKERSD